MTDELTLPDVTGLYNDFKKGLVYWSSVTYVNEIQGILPKVAFSWCSTNTRLHITFRQEFLL